MQRSRLYVNNKKLAITRVNAFLKQIEQLFLVKSNIDSNRRKTYSLASKTSSEFRTRQKISESRDEHIFFALDYVLESLQRSRLYVNNKKIINNEGKRVFEAN